MNSSTVRGMACLDPSELQVSMINRKDKQSIDMVLELRIVKSTLKGGIRTPRGNNLLAPPRRATATRRGATCHVPLLIHVKNRRVTYGNCRQGSFIRDALALSATTTLFPPHHHLLSSQPFSRPLYTLNGSQSAYTLTFYIHSYGSDGGAYSPHPPLERLLPPLPPRLPPRARPPPSQQRRAPRRSQKMARRRRGRRPARRLTVHTSTRVRFLYCLIRCSSSHMSSSTTVLKQVHPDTGISNKAMAILNSFVQDIFERIATEASSASPSSRCFHHGSDATFLFSLHSCRARIILQEIYYLFARDPDRCSFDPARRALQARHLGGDQVCHQYAFSVFFLLPFSDQHCDSTEYSSAGAK